MIERVPGEGKYAQLEREQRWLLATLPSELTLVGDIHDRYIIGTRVRLRRIGEVYKLTQKVPVALDAVKLTTAYLSPAEYEVFAALPAHEVRKRRSHLSYEGHTLAVDEFLDRDLLLAEVELTADEPYLRLPSFAVRDVTGDPAYSGGGLAK